MAEAAKDAGVKHVIWSTLEDTRQRVPLSDDRMPTLHGQVQGPALRRQGRGGRASSASSASDDLPAARRFYWDNLIYFGMGPKQGPDGTLAFTMPMGDKKLPGIAAEDIGRCAYGVFKRARAHRQDGGHRGRAPDRRADGGGSRQGARQAGRATTPCPPEAFRKLRLPRRRGPRQHVPVQARRSRPSSAARATSPSRARSTRSCRRSRSGWRRTPSASRSAEDLTGALSWRSLPSARAIVRTPSGRSSGLVVPRPLSQRVLGTARKDRPRLPSYSERSRCRAARCSGVSSVSWRSSGSGWSQPTATGASAADLELQVLDRRDARVAHLALVEAWRTPSCRPRASRRGASAARATA